MDIKALTKQRNNTILRQKQNKNRTSSKMRLQLSLIALSWAPIVAQYACTVCKGGEGITRPNGIVTTEQGQTASCVALTYNVGQLTEEACRSVQNLAAEPCGCPIQEAPIGSNSAVQSVSVPPPESNSFMCSVCESGEMRNPEAFTLDSAGIPISCQALEDTRESIPESACERVRSFAAVPCGCDEDVPATIDTLIENNSEAFICSICGDGIIGNPNGLVVNSRGMSKTCGELEANKKNIPSSMCSSLQNSALGPCECAFGVSTEEGTVASASEGAQSGSEAASPVGGTEIEQVYSECSICGDGEMTIPNGIVSARDGRTARCDLLEANLKQATPSTCSSIQALAKQPCGCEPPSQGVDTNIPDNIVSFECTLCAEGEVTIPDGVVTTPQGQSARCDALEANAKSIPQEICPVIQQLSNSPCGCTKVESAPVEEVVPPSFQCPVCGDGKFVTRPDGIISTAESEKTCAQYQEEAMRGEIDEDQCPFLQQLSGDACGCATPPTFPTDAPTPYECQVCGIGREVGLLDAQVTLPNLMKMSCGTLQDRAERGLIHSSQCARYVPLAQQYCGCVRKEYVASPDPQLNSNCNICGNSRKVMKTDGIVVIPNQPDRTCMELMTEAANGNISPDQCSLLHPFVQEPCGCEQSTSLTSSDKHGDCFQDLNEIQALERAVQDTSTTRLYVLCPDTKFDIGVWTEEGGITDGQPFIALRPNVIYQCGHDGSRSNDCILSGGDFGLASYDGVYEGIHENVSSVHIRGLTFESQNLFSVLLKSAGDITFKDCAFKGNSNNVPVLMQWEDQEGIATEDRRLEGDEGELKQVVTFQDCVFRNNVVDDSLSFPGIIENSFNSELIVRNCLFQENIYGSNNNLANTGYAIRSFGPLTLESTCFIDNEFLNHGPVLVYGTQYSASNNYVESSQQDLTCELSALFNSRDDMAGGTPSCESSDASVCAFSQGPTSSPTISPSLPTEEKTSQDTSSAISLTGQQFSTFGTTILSTLLLFCLFTFGK